MQCVVRKPNICSPILHVRDIFTLFDSSSCPFGASLEDESILFLAGTVEPNGDYADIAQGLVKKNLFEIPVTILSSNPLL